MAEKSINIRLSLRDGEVVKRALTSLGEEGQRALRRIEGEGPAVSKSLALIDEAVHRTKDRFSELAHEAPAGLSILSKLGPAGIAAAAGLGLVAEQLHEGLKAYAATEQAQLRLEAVLKATGSAAGVTGGQIAEYAGNIASNTMATGVQVREAAAILATFGSVAGENFKRALTLSQDLAEAFGGDMVSSARQLGKALDDPIEGLTALRRAGISFTEAQRAAITAMVEAGDQAGAQTQILDLLTKKVGGAGGSGTDSLAGAWNQSGKAAEEFAKNLVTVTGAAKLTQIGLQGVASTLGDLSKLMEETPISVKIIAAEKALIQAEDELTKARSAPGMMGTGFQESRVAELRKQLDDLIATARAQADKVEAAEGGQKIAEGNRATDQASASLAKLNQQLERFASGTEKIARAREGLAKTMTELEALRKTGGDPATIDKAEAAAQEMARRNIAAIQEEMKKAAGNSEEARAKKKADDLAEAEHQRLLEEGKRVYQSVRTAAEEYADAIAHLNDLKKAGVLTETIYQRAVAAEADKFREAAVAERDRILSERTDAAAGVERALSSMRKSALDDATAVEDAFTGIFSSIEDTIVKAAETGKLSLEDLEKSVRGMLARLSLHFLEAALFNATGLGATPGIALPAGPGGPGAGLSSAFVPAIAKAIADAVVTPTAYVPAQRGLLQSQWVTQVAKPSMLPVQLPVMQSDVGGGMTVSPLGLTPAGLIRSFENYRSNAYWDVNAYRAGYGSDTTTDAAGNVSRVTAATTTSIADATRDLTRRVADFQSVITGQIGPDAWARLGPNSKASLTSVAYNYGSLPSNVATAAQTGDPNQIASAIRGLSANPDRRIAEAQNVLLDNSEKMADSTRQMTTSVDRSTQELSASLKGVADGTQKAGQEFANKFPSGLQSMMQAIGQSGGGMLNFFGTEFNSSFAKFLGPIGRPHGYYRRGDVFDRPRVFPMAQGWGLMAEAGPEAVMPLRRTRGGDLGVILAGAGNDNRTAPQMSVQIINQFGGEANVETRQTRRSDGSPGLDVIFKRQVDQRINEQVPRINEVGFGQQKRLKLR